MRTYKIDHEGASAYVVASTMQRAIEAWHRHVDLDAGEGYSSDVDPQSCRVEEEVAVIVDREEPSARSLPDADAAAAKPAATVMVSLAAREIRRLCDEVLLPTGVAPNGNEVRDYHDERTAHAGCSCRARITSGCYGEASKFGADYYPFGDAEALDTEFAYLEAALSSLLGDSGGFRTQRLAHVASCTACTAADRVAVVRVERDIPLGTVRRDYAIA